MAELCLANIRSGLTSLREFAQRIPVVAHPFARQPHLFIVSCVPANDLQYSVGGLGKQKRVAGLQVQTVEDIDREFNTQRLAHGT